MKMPPNEITALDAAMACQVASGRHWRGASEFLRFCCEMTTADINTIQTELEMTFPASLKTFYSTALRSQTFGCKRVSLKKNILLITNNLQN